MAMVCLTSVVGLSCLTGALVLGLSFDTTRAVLWFFSSFFILLAQVAIAEPLKIFVLAMFWAYSRKNVLK